MKLILILSTFLVVWSAKGHSDLLRTPRSPYNCGVQLTRGKGGGIYYAFGASNYGGGSGVVYQKAATSLPSSSVTSDNRHYHGSYGRYPGGSSAHSGQNGYQGSSSSSQYGGASGSNYGSGYGSSGSSPNYGSSSSSYGSQSYGNSGYNGNRGGGGGSSHGSIGGAGYGSSLDSSSYSSNSGSSASANNGWNGGASGYDSDARFTSDVLSAHNSYRARHNTPPVTLDTKMSLKAQQWAEEMAFGRAAYGHSPDAVEGIFGESLQVVNDPYPSALDVMDRWYDERANYSFKSPKIVKKPFNQRNSHFTAMIWYGTKRIGVGKATSPINGKSYIVVTYYPPGNNVDILENNVFPPA